VVGIRCQHAPNCTDVVIGVDAMGGRECPSETVKIWIEGSCEQEDLFEAGIFRGDQQSPIPH
jgi:hypothetical protein